MMDARMALTKNTDSTSVPHAHVNDADVLRAFPTQSRLAVIAKFMLCIAVLVPFSASARTIDLSKASCAEFTSLESMEKEQIVLWLAGYYAGSAQRAVLDIPLLSEASGALNELCTKTPALMLIGPETRPLLSRPAAQ